MIDIEEQIDMREERNRRITWATLQRDDSQWDAMIFEWDDESSGVFHAITKPTQDEAYIAVCQWIARKERQG